MAKVYDQKGFADAVSNGDDTIEIEGSFAEEVFRIRATGKVSWAIAIAAITIAVAVLVATIPSKEKGDAIGTTEVAKFVVDPAAFSILGTNATITAISIAVAAGGVGVLSRIRNDYKIQEHRKGYLLLKKKVS